MAAQAWVIQYNQSTRAVVSSLVWTTVSLLFCKHLLSVRAAMQQWDADTSFCSSSPSLFLAFMSLPAAQLLSLSFSLALPPSPPLSRSAAAAAAVAVHQQQTLARQSSWLQRLQWQSKQTTVFWRRCLMWKWTVSLRRIYLSSSKSGSDFRLFRFPKNMVKQVFSSWVFKDARKTSSRRRKTEVEREASNGKKNNPSKKQKKCNVQNQCACFDLSKKALCAHARMPSVNSECHSYSFL